MFLKRDYRDRAIGLMGAFGVLITGVALTGAVTPAPKAPPPEPIETTADGPLAKWTREEMGSLPIC